METFLEILVLLIVTRIFSAFAIRGGQPPSIGELTAGFVLAIAASLFGSSVPFLTQLPQSDTLHTIAQLGIFSLVLMAGMESNADELHQHSGSALWVALGGAVLPLVCGIGLGWIFLPPSEAKPVLALLIGVTMSITGIPATVKALTELKLLHSRMGQMIVGAAIFDDILGLFLLAILTTMIQSGHLPDFLSLMFLLGKVLLFFAMTITLGIHVYPKVSKHLKAFQMIELELGALIGVALGYGFIAEALNMHWILGAFMAGLYFDPSRVGKEAYENIHLMVNAITKGFLGPLFFAYIGLQVHFEAIINIPVFMSLLLILAFLGKMIGSGVPAYWLGLSRRQALSVGIGMSCRGAVELIVVSIALEAGLFVQHDQLHPIVTHLFSALVLMGIATTFFSIVILRRILPKSPH